MPNAPLLERSPPLGRLRPSGASLPILLTHSHWFASSALSTAASSCGALVCHSLATVPYRGGTFYEGLAVFPFIQYGRQRVKLNAETTQFYRFPSFVRGPGFVGSASVQSTAIGAKAWSAPLWRGCACTQTTFARGPPSRPCCFGSASGSCWRCRLRARIFAPELSPNDSPLQ